MTDSARRIGSDLPTVMPESSGKRIPEAPPLMRASAAAYDLPLEDLSTQEIRDRFPMFRIEDGWIGTFEPRAGAVFPERCIQAFHSGLNRSGADIRLDEQVHSWRRAGSGIEAHTSSGTYGAERLVVTAGHGSPT